LGEGWGGRPGVNLCFMLYLFFADLL
jgi:hypothetical protein